jgi:hypothetical protein
MAISRLTLIERLNRYLRSIEQRDIEPGRWEAHCIKQALAALNHGNIVEAEGHMNLAKMPPDLRTSHTLVGFSPQDRSPTLAELQAELARIRSMATRK